MPSDETAGVYSSRTRRERLRRKKSPRCDSGSFVTARFKRGLIWSLARRKIAGLQQEEGGVREARVILSQKVLRQASTLAAKVIGKIRPVCVDDKLRVLNQDI